MKVANREQRLTSWRELSTAANAPQNSGTEAKLREFFRENMQNIVKLKASDITMPLQLSSILNKAFSLDKSPRFRGDYVAKILNGWSDGGQLKGIFKYIAEGEGSREIANIFNYLSGTEERLAEFVDACRVKVFRTKTHEEQTGLEFIASNCNAQEISMILSALVKLKDGGEKLAEFVEYCFRNRRDGRNALMVVAQEGNAQEISITLSALAKLEDRGENLAEFVEYCSIDIGGTTGLKFIAEEGNSQAISVALSALTKLKDGGKKLAEFVEYCSIDIGGTTGLKLIAAEGSAQAISVTLSALAKLEDGGEKLAEFVEYCFRNRRDGRNALMVVAQEGSASDISNSACALKQIKRYLHDFIEICKNVKRRDCGTNALKYVASNGMDLDMMLLINTTYIDSVLYHTDMDSEIIGRGIKILKSNTASNLDKIIILESLARVQESSPEENKYRINDLLSSGGSNKLRNDVWKEYSDGSLEFDCPLEKIRNRLPEENKVGLSRCKQLVRVEIINACIKVMEARCSKDENAKEREDYHHGLLMDAIELRAEINNLIKHGPKSHNVRETDDKATYAKSEPAHTQASSHSAEYRRDCAPKNCGPTKWRQEANKCTSGESKLGVQSCSAAQEYSGKRNKRGSFPRF